MPTSAEYSLGRHAFPRGWLAVALAADVGTVPFALRFCGEDAVLYRGQSGSLHMVEAYCPHMGAHLGIGAGSATERFGLRVSGDDIRCPNHGWVFGPDGQVKRIPYSDIQLPKSVCLRNWPVEERAGVVFAWHDQEGGEPDYALPDCSEWSDPRWILSDPVKTGVMPVHPVEIAEHGVDKIHLANVHGADRLLEHRVQFDGHRVETVSTSVQLDATGAQAVPVTAYSRYYGPGFLLAEVEAQPKIILLFAHTAVDDGTSMGFFRTAMRIAGDQPTGQDQVVLEQVHAVMLGQFEQDMTIFMHKRPTLRAVQIPGDGPFRRYRQWYAQFYEPRAHRAAIQATTQGEVATPAVHNAPWIAQGAA